MKIENIELTRLRMPLKSPFETSFGKTTVKDFFIIAAHGAGHVGYAESVALNAPIYNEETTDTAIQIIRQFLIPLLQKAKINTPEDVAQVFAPIRRNNMAKSAVESAIWDLYAKKQGISLSQALGGTRQEIEVGVSIGIEPSIPALLEKVSRFLEEGYKKIKIKIKPGWDIEPIQAIRTELGYDVPLMADANSAYSLQDIELLQQLDPYHLLMIEQPLAHDDIIDHAQLQKKLKTRICLDESIHTVEDARKAIELGSCKIMNIKVGRVGGLTEAKKIHDLCQEQDIPVWCGGMLESGIGRAHNIALASLANFTIPGDTSASNRYWKQDIVQPAVDFIRPGYIAVPQAPGIGYQLDREALERYTIDKVSMEISE